MSPTVIRGSSDANGSWKIICIFRRTRRSAAPRSLVISCPSKLIVPPVTGSKPVTSRASVDLPHPDSPTRPRVSPRLISRSTPSTARTASPEKPPTGKCLYTVLIRTSTGSLRTAVACNAAASAANVVTRLDRRCLQLLGRLLGDRALLGGLEAFFLDIPHQDPASRHLIGGDLAERRFRVDLALVDHEGASRVEFAARRWVREVGWQSLDRHEPVLPRLVDARDGAQERPGVGMLRALEDLIHRAFFDDPAGVHHDDSLAEAGDQRHVVGDEHHGGVQLAVELLHELDDLGLDRDVEGRR